MRATLQLATRTSGYPARGRDGMRSMRTPSTWSTEPRKRVFSYEGAITMASWPRSRRYSRTRMTEWVTPLTWGRNCSATSAILTVPRVGAAPHRSVTPRWPAGEIRANTAALADGAGVGGWEG